jgi:hypothetical protein
MRNAESGIDCGPQDYRTTDHGTTDYEPSRNTQRLPEHQRVGDVAALAALRQTLPALIPIRLRVPPRRAMADSDPTRETVASIAPRAAAGSWQHARRKAVSAWRRASARTTQSAKRIEHSAEGRGRGQQAGQLVKWSSGQLGVARRKAHGAWRMASARKTQSGKRKAHGAKGRRRLADQNADCGMRNDGGEVRGERRKTAGWLLDNQVRGW